MTLFRLAALTAAAVALFPLTPIGSPVARAGSTQLTQRAPARLPASAAAQASAEGAASAASTTQIDPMERLRQRLSERLAAPGGPAVSGTLDLQVGTRSVPAAAHAAPAVAHGSAPRLAVAAPAARPAVPAATAHGTDAAVAAHGTAAAAVPARRATAALSQTAAHAEAIHWDYEGAGGPAAWGALRPDYNLCANGQRQSPIDIRGGLAVDLEPVKFDYRPSSFSVIDNGHTVQVNLPPGNAIEVGTRRFELVQFHFHRPSEERIDGRQFEMSLHLVHKDAAGKLAVVGVLLGKGPAHPAVQTVWNNLPLERNEEAAARAQINPADLLPAERRYFTYMGSLTTPPCSEGVLWVVMRQPATLTPDQIELFARIYPMNARPVQPASGRRIMQSQ